MYEITNDGRVFNNGKQLKLSLAGKGYLAFSKYANGSRKTALVHIEVAKLYVPNPLNLSQVNHIDGCKTNNNDWNLEWCTPKENTHHSIRTGLRNDKCENHVNSKLSKNIVLEIRAKYIPRIYSTHRLAKEYGVSQRLILNIIHNKTWVI